MVDSVTCKKCGALIVLITRYGNFRGKKKLLERERLTGNKAINFLKETSKNRISQVVKCPLKMCLLANILILNMEKLLIPKLNEPDI